MVKQAISAAVLTGNRFVLGVGTSPWREDYEVLGVDWDSRGPRMDAGYTAGETWARYPGCSLASASTVAAQEQLTVRSRYT